MDRRTDWPWDWQEEAEWKAELEERDDDFVEWLIDSAVEDAITGAPVLEPRETQESGENATPEKYLVAA